MRITTTLFYGSILFLCIILGTSCSGLENDATKKVSVLWEREVHRGCLNKDPFAFGPEANYNVNTHNHLGRLFYHKYDPLGSDGSSYVIEDKHNAFTVNYAFGGIIKDENTGSLYILDGHWGEYALYNVDESTFIRAKQWLGEKGLLSINAFKIYDDKIYVVENIDDAFKLVAYDNQLSTRSLLYEFDIPLDKKVSLESIYEWEGTTYGSFKVSNASAPYDDASKLIQLDVGNQEVVWTMDIPSLASNNHFIGDEMYILMNGKESLVVELETGNLIRNIPVLGDEFSFKKITDDHILIRDREYIDGVPNTEWLRVLDINTLEEVMALEGLYLGMNGDKVYSYNSESIVQVASISNPSNIENIDLRAIFEHEIPYGLWKMAEGSNLLLGIYETCNTAFLTLLELP